ncbi:MAG TPA: Fe-S cluster assembly protein SufD [Methylocella sp.]|nr:Fe-S cluster assembly protein SufD [Methylocella sp.]
MSEIASFNDFLQRMAGIEDVSVPWLGALREEARTLFAGSGLPTRRVEAWKYSDLSRALALAARDSGPARPTPSPPGAHTVLFENGALAEGKSAPAEAGAMPLRNVLADPQTPFAKLIGHVYPQKDHAILNLNTALMEDGLVLHVRPNTTLPAPLFIRHDWEGEGARTPEGRHLRLLIVLDDGAEATVIEAHSGSPGFSTVVTEVALAAGARLNHIRFERFGAAARQSAVTLAEVKSSASYKGFYLSEGGLFCRHEALLRLSGKDAQADLGGIFLTAEGRHCDNTIVITHAGPDTASRQIFRGALSGDSRGVFQGCVRVRPEAQGADARQLSRALLLSRQAEAAIKPELEILADNVKCSHGATTGELDPAALFYLRARGIPEAKARELLIEAFLAEVIAALESEALRACAEAFVSDWLSGQTNEIPHAR